VFRTLVVQRNNVGDLVLATPFVGELRRQFPAARIDVLASTYNAPVLDSNPDVDRVHAYTKRKHLPGRHPLLRPYWENAKVLLLLRRERFDYIFLLAGCNSPRHLAFAKLLAPRKIVTFSTETLESILPRHARSIQLERIAEQHVVPRSLLLLQTALGLGHFRDISPKLLPCKVFPDAGVRSARLAGLVERGLDTSRPTIALHISARRIKQRWQEERLADLARKLTTRLGAQVLLLWAPGPADALMHPGDDERARRIASVSRDIPVISCPSASLSEMIAALSICDLVVSSDGGAVHLAAACGLPVVALFGDANSRLWHPWCPLYHVVQDPAGDVRNVPVELVFDAVEGLLWQVPSERPRPPGRLRGPKPMPIGSCSLRANR
jgi:ADP-heptose:LPS heptosyltransferase